MSSASPFAVVIALALLNAKVTINSFISASFDSFKERTFMQLLVHLTHCQNFLDLKARSQDFVLLLETHLNLFRQV